VNYSRSCSWCHQENPIDHIFCGGCGHQAHLPRMACDCPRCNRPRRPEARNKREDLLEEADAVCDLITGLLASQEQVHGWLRTALAHLRHLRAAIAATDDAWDEEMSLAEVKLAIVAEVRRNERQSVDDDLTSGPFAGLPHEQRAT
jgi:hypothetical protein